VSVYGISHLSTVGSIVLSYAIDGGLPSRATLPSRGDAEYPDQPNYLLISSGELAAGNHTLTVNLTECQNQTLDIDYILYEPSFSTLATQENLTAISSTATSSRVPTSSGASAPSTSSIASSSPTIATRNHDNIGAIVGGVVGAFAALSALLILFFCRRNHEHRKLESEPCRVRVIDTITSAVPTTSRSEKMSSMALTPSSPAYGELQARINALEQENARLAPWAPPQYESLSDSENIPGPSSPRRLKEVSLSALPIF